MKISTPPEKMPVILLILFACLLIGRSNAADLRVDIGRSDDPGPVVHLSIAGTDVSHQYQVNRAFDITANNWSLVGTVPGAAGMTLFDDSAIGSAAKGFYQIMPIVPVSIPRTTWGVPIVDSEELTNGPNNDLPPTPGINATDGDPNTFWHTQWNTENPPGLPHYIQFDLGALFSVAGFRHLPRQDGLPNGRIAQYEFYVSLDGINWGSAVASGTFSDTMDWTEVLFTPQTAKFVKLVALSSYPIGNFATSLAELDILTEKFPQPQITSPATDTVITVGQSVTFNGSANDMNANATVNYQWTFSPDSGVPNSIQQNPGMIQFNTSGTFTVTLSVTDSLGLGGSGSVTRTITVLPSTANNIARTGWTLYFVDSEELTDGGGCCAPTPATNAFDGDPTTFWHTQWVSAQPDHPHDIVINLGATQSIIGFRHLPRQDGLPNGRIGHYEFYVTNTTDELGAPVWGAAVATGLLPDSASETEVRFAPVSGQFIWLRALDALPDNTATSLAELNVVTDQ